MVESKTKGYIPRSPISFGNSQEMPGNIVEKESERRVFGKVFGSGLKQVSLSSRTVGSFHETHHCSTGFILPLVCLFLPTAHPASPSFARVFSSLFLSVSLPLFLPLSFFLALFLDLCRRHIFLSRFLFLSIPGYLPFPPRTFCRMACLTAGLLRPVCQRGACSVLVVVVGSRWRGWARS